MRLSREREKKHKKMEKEFQESMKQHKDDQDALDAAKKVMLETMQDSYSEMNDKMLKINQMIAELQAQAEAQRDDREAYERENGITDGQERMQQAMDEARARHALNEERLGLRRPENTYASVEGSEEDKKEQTDQKSEGVSPPPSQEQVD